MPKKTSTDWRDLILDAVTESKPKIITTGLRLDGPSNRIIRQAAKRRGMSPAAFMRRAAVAMALYDLKQNDQWDSVNSDEPGFTAFGTHMGKAPFRPNGHGFGPWRIEKVSKHHADD